MIFVSGIKLENIILAAFTSGEEFCRFWDKLEFDMTELDEDEPALSQESKLQGRFDYGPQRHYRQSAICIDFIF